jgi:hypothetical protein
MPWGRNTLVVRFPNKAYALFRTPKYKNHRRVILCFEARMGISSYRSGRGLTSCSPGTEQDMFDLFDSLIKLTFYSAPQNTKIT